MRLWIHNQKYQRVTENCFILVNKYNKGITPHEPARKS